MIFRSVIGVSIIFLSGCNSAPHKTIDTTTPGYKPSGAFSHCDKLTPNYDVTRKNAYPYYKCIYETKSKYGVSNDQQEIEADRKRMMLAKDYSAGKFTNEEYTKINTEIGNQLTLARLGEMQKEVEKKEFQQTIVNQNQKLLDQNQQVIDNNSRPVITNCNKYGENTRCTTY